MGGPGTRYRSSVQVLCNSPSDLQSVTGPKFPRTGVDCRYCTAGPPHPCLSNENWILTKLQSSVTLSGLITFFTIIQNVPYRAVLVFNLVYNQVFIGYMNSKLQTKHWWRFLLSVPYLLRSKLWPLLSGGWCRESGRGPYVSDRGAWWRRSWQCGGGRRSSHSCSHNWQLASPRIIRMYSELPNGRHVRQRHGWCEKWSGTSRMSPEVGKYSVSERASCCCVDMFRVPTNSFAAQEKANARLRELARRGRREPRGGIHATEHSPFLT